jgi:hypothetical protein
MKELGYNAHLSHGAEFSWGSKPGPQFMKRMAQALRVSNLDILNCSVVPPNVGAARRVAPYYNLMEQASRICPGRPSSLLQEQHPGGGHPHGPGQIDGRTGEGDAASAKMFGEGTCCVGVKTAAQTIIPFPLY